MLCYVNSIHEMLIFYVPRLDENRNDANSDGIIHFPALYYDRATVRLDGKFFSL